MMENGSSILYVLSVDIPMCCVHLLALCGDPSQDVRTLQQAADLLGCHEKTARIHMGKLKKLGMVAKIGEKYRALPPTGNDWAELPLQIWFDRALLGSDISVLAAIFYSERMRGFHPKDRIIAKLTGLTLRSVSRSRWALKKAGWLKWSKKEGIFHYSLGRKINNLNSK
jgi:Mn-dependent DtxR family transcriptional regulator